MPAVGGRSASNACFEKWIGNRSVPAFGLWSVLYFGPTMKTNILRFDRLSHRWVRVLWAALVCLAGLPAPAVAQPRDVLTATAVSQRAKTTPGDKFAVAVILNLEEGWHVWPNKPVLPKGMEDVVATPT